MGHSAFNGCTNLREVTIGNGVTSMGNYAFQDCTYLKKITFKGTKEQWDKITKGTDWKKNVPAFCMVYCKDETISISNAG